MNNVIDVSPELLQMVRSTFEKEYSSNIRIKELYKKIQNGTATYVEADDFAVEIGSILSKAFGSNLSSDVLPDGKMYYNIAKSVIEPMMVNNYDLVASVAQQIQTNMNKAAGIGIKAIVPELNQDRIDGIINGISNADDFDSAKWRLGEPIVIFSQSIIMDSIRENAKFQYNAGLGPKIVRQSTGKCCDWCNQVVGTYEYPDVPKDVYRRHDYCRCKVDYVLGRYRHNVHNNNKGKRRYVQDEYGGYVKTKEARIETAKQLQATEKARKEAARQKRIETWQKKKNKAEIDNVEVLNNSDIMIAQGSSGMAKSMRIPDANVRSQVMREAIGAPEPIYAEDLRLAYESYGVQKFGDCYDIVLHGTSYYVEYEHKYILDTETLFYIISGRKDYKMQDIRLLSCSTGKVDKYGNCVAQQLSDALGVRVYAPVDELLFNPDGTLFVGRRQRLSMEDGFRWFEPKKGGKR